MSRLSQLFNGEQRSSQQTVGHPRDPVLAQWLGGGTNTAAGISVTSENVMRLAAVYACVRILTSSIASLPLQLFRKTSEGREEASDHPLYRLLHTAPNRWQTSLEFREMLQGHLLLRGNGYARKVFRNDGGLAELVPMHPDRTRPFRAPDDSIAYEYTDDKGRAHIYLQDEVLHLKGLSLDGLKGLSPIDAARETFGLSMAADRFGAEYFGNGTVVSGVLQTDDELSEEAYERLKQSWSERHAGTGNAHRPAILESGLKWQSLSVVPEQAQFLETRKFQRSEIAMIFGVPPHMLGDVEKSTSWGAGIEQQGIGFVVYSLQPWLVRWEQRLDRDVVSGRGLDNHYAEFKVDALLRGDSKARAEFYKNLFGLGAISQNEIRQKENMNPIDNGDVYYVPLNMVSSEEAAKQKDQDSGGGNNDNDAGEPMPRFHRNMFRNAVDRIVTCEIKALERSISACGADVEALELRITQFYREHPPFMLRHLRPVAGALSESIVPAYIEAGLRQAREALRSDDAAAGLNHLLSDWKANKSEALTRRLADMALEEIINEE